MRVCWAQQSPLARRLHGEWGWLAKLQAVCWYVWCLQQAAQIFYGNVVIVMGLLGTVMPTVEGSQCMPLPPSSHMSSRTSPLLLLQSSLGLLSQVTARQLHSYSVQNTLRGRF